MNNQTKDPIEEILIKYGAFLTGIQGTRYNRQEALTAINKEIERIGLEVIGAKEKHLPIDDVYRSPEEINLYYAERHGHDRAITEMRTRLTQALKGREGESHG